ncbi:MAG: hypothetical protein IJ800_07320 [Clostridia bacterium]|nr:hypothetical protein [Clostridia bacterium]
MKTLKFGGSSLAGAREFSLTADATRKQKEVAAIVVSAGGKTDRQDKITDVLIKAYFSVKKGEDLYRAISPFYERLCGIKRELRLKTDIDILRMKIGRGFEKQPTLDFLVSRGEYCFAILVAEYLGYAFLDAGEVMKFDADGKFNLEFSKFLIKDFYLKHGKFVCGGFYGSDGEGKIKLFGRGGSDFSGAVVAAALSTDYVNFTDVDGFYPIDPKICASVSPIERMGFNEARIISEFGAGVLHPDSVLPLVGTGLTITVKNTFSPDLKGTVVCEDGEGEVSAVAKRNNCAYLELNGINEGYDLLKRLSEIKDLKSVALSVRADKVSAVVSGSENLFALSSAGKFRNYTATDKVSLYYFARGEKSRSAYERARKEVACLLAVDTRDGFYLAVREEDRDEVDKKVILAFS